jgi:hypothetical protein
MLAGNKAAIPKRIEGNAVRVPDRAHVFRSSAEHSAFC